MRLGYNTNGLQNHRLDDALRLLADQGFEAVAITPDICHLDPFHCTAGEVERIGTLLDQLGLSCSIETGARFLLDPAHKHEPTLMTADERGRQRRIEFLWRAANLGRDLGARVVSFWTGIDRANGPESRSRLLSSVRAACAAIRECGLVPSLEPEPGMAVATVADWKSVRLELGTEAPAMTLDVGHLYAEWEGDPVALCRAHAHEVAQVHLEDMRRGIHEHLLPGTGDVDFPAVLAALGEGGYAGPVCFELSRHSHMAPQALAACRQVWLDRR